jgi:UDP-N-acetylglucosamine 1-carboxyvinyltransferase
MSTLVIEGGRRLQGRIRVSGNKNAALPLLAACLLTEQECVLHNVPKIRDVEVMARLLESLGATVSGLGTGSLRICCASVRTSEPDRALVGKLRGSVLLLGPLLARTGRAAIGEPGGDFPSRRTIATHLAAVLALGAKRAEAGGPLEAPEGLQGASFYLSEASVTGTETALLAAATAEGATEIRHAACEPHVAELCRFLGKMGARVEGIGSATLRVVGQPELRGAEHTLDGDYIEAGSYGVVAALTAGSIEVAGVRPVDMEPIVAVLQRLGVACFAQDDVFSVSSAQLEAAARITTGLWPGFPSDLVSLVTVLATQCPGSTLVHDWLYELRLFALEQLSAMGADLLLCDPHRIIVTGPRRLRGRSLDARDIRSGMALIAAALCAEGQSRVSSLETVERGYGDLVEHLHALGANVHRAS